jgi:hypothetical protein
MSAALMLPAKYFLKRKVKIHTFHALYRVQSGKKSRPKMALGSTLDPK